MRSSGRLAALAMMLVVSCGSGTSPERPDDGGLNERVAELAAEHVQDDEPGVAVMVMRKGEVVHESGHGLANLKTRRGVTPETIFHLASAGKQLTGVAVMLLAHEGKLDYDDPVGEHIEELADFDDRVTIRRLLLHTAAMNDDVYDELQESHAAPTNDDLLELLAETPLDGEPGAADEYSNVGYDVLGSVVERASGQPFETFVGERIFDKLGMSSTFSVPNPEGLANPLRATGYTATDDGFEVLDSDPLDGLRGAGSVYTTVRDLAIYDRALDDDSLLPQEVVAEAFEPGSLDSGEELDYGFGWEIGDHDGVRYAGHEGSWSGYSSYYLRLPEESVTVVVLANRDNLDSVRLAFDVATLFVDGDEGGQ